jgi:hypothetical protein
VNRFFLILEKPIAEFVYTNLKEFFLSLSLNFPPKVLSRKFRDRFFAKESHKYLGRMPGWGMEVEYPNKLPLYS